MPRTQSPAPVRSLERRRRAPHLRPLVAAALGAVAVGGCASSGMGRSGGRPGTRGELRHAIDSMVASPTFSNAHWGILIVDPERGDTIYSRNAGKLFMPASNQKIVTGSVALALLGPDYQFTTAFAARGPVEGGVLRGDLVVIGRGDPSMSDHMRGDVMQALRAVPDSLRAHDVRYVSGRLQRAGDAFPDAWHGFGWGWDDFDAAYSAGVDELFFNEGMFQVTVRGGTREGARATTTVRPDIGFPSLRALVTTARRPDSVRAADSTARVPRLRSPSATMDSASNVVTITGQIYSGDSTTLDLAYRDPGLAYLHALRKTLADQALTIEGGLDPRVPRDTAARLDTLFVMQSPPLREILPALEKPSQNQIAEIFFKTLGLERTGVGTADSGRAVVERQLTEWGIAPTSFAVRDGSGLSRHDYIAPDAIVRVLDTMRKSPNFAVFRDALPIAGMDGTIANRMRGTAAAGNVHAKTGFVDKARSLSGYVTTADGRVLIFSLLCNNWTTSSREVDQVADAIAVRLAALRGG
jgi:D-alanyl-D-alanine carboxypeptidase/D-alanyl-D-alanine-endopeptidase (penicillin-binding protein 4)